MVVFLLPCTATEHKAAMRWILQHAELLLQGVPERDLEHPGG